MPKIAIDPEIEAELGMNDAAAFRDDPAASSSFGLRWRTAEEVALEAGKVPPWIAKPWVVKGALTEISSKPKVGKTTFFAHLIKCVLYGQDFLGEPSIQMPVIYLTEEPPNVFNRVIQRSDLATERNMHILMWHETYGYSWSSIVKAAAEKCKAVGSSMMVVDTVPQFAGMQGDDENKSGAVYTAVGPLRMAAANYNLAIVLVRHDRKSGGDVGDSGRGSSAWAGAVDILMSYRYGPNIHSSYREIQAKGRYEEANGPQGIILDENGVFIKTAGPGVAVDEAEVKMLAAAPIAEPEAMSAPQLIKKAGVYRTTGATALKNLTEAGALLMKGTGAKNNPKKYWRPSEDTKAG